MTEVLFYHLQNMTVENVLPPLLEKSLERGWRVVVQSTSPERADALWYANDRFKPKFMINLATLTGAVMVALGQH